MKATKKVLKTFQSKDLFREQGRVIFDKSSGLIIAYREGGEVERIKVSEPQPPPVQDKQQLTINLF